MRKLVIIISILLLSGCTDISHEELETFFRKHKISGNIPVAIKKYSAEGGLLGISAEAYESYLLTVHGYPDNFLVCQDIIKPYNEDPELSVVPGIYFCDVLD